MGMYTSVMSSDIEIIEPKHKQLMEWLNDKKVPSYVKMKPVGKKDATGRDDISVEYVWWKDVLLKELKDDPQNEDNAFYEIFNERKIIGYWYPGFLMFLRDLAQFVDGECELQYEDGQSYAKLVFQDGECRIRYGEISYTDSEALDLSPLPEHEQLQRRL